MITDGLRRGRQSYIQKNAAFSVMAIMKPNQSHSKIRWIVQWQLQRRNPETRHSTLRFKAASTTRTRTTLTSISASRRSVSSAKAASGKCSKLEAERMEKSTRLRKRSKSSGAKRIDGSGWRKSNATSSSPTTSTAWLCTTPGNKTTSCSCRSSFVVEASKITLRRSRKSPSRSSGLSC